jgi:hypothetical protein
MALLSGFNADDYKGDDLFPDGEYSVIITESELTPRTKGNGDDWKFVFQVMDGKLQNRQITFWLAFDIPGATGGMEQALQIGKRTISDICRAVNITTPKRTEELKGKTLKLKLKIKEGKDGVARNQIQKCTARLTAAKPVQKNMVEQAFETEAVASAPTEKKNPFA